MMLFTNITCNDAIASYRFSPHGEFLQPVLRLFNGRPCVVKLISCLAVEEVDTDPFSVLTELFWSARVTLRQRFEQFPVRGAISLQLCFSILNHSEYSNGGKDDGVYNRI
jgi:hypothetical protein